MVVEWRDRPTAFRLAALGSLALVATMGGLRASQVRPVNLEEMTERADRIFAGRCLGMEAIDQGLVEVSFEVERAVKGTVGDRLVLKMPDASAAAGGMAGVPGFRPGESVVLFLYGESSCGRTSPVGLGQGKFRVSEDKRGARRAVNATGNRFLFEGLSEGARARLAGAIPADPEAAAAGLAPDDLLDLAEALLR